ncbi:maleylpyruvate isomerase N-terminal domain-containing protein [Occultella gossypii]|uniref:Maleylpyruvate isomerase family mycothiol-dependent enzyme n=1 Tax=Occultella gossypii TaxID=2800820 RepID=A0ABS7SGW3_9MICO|nr:maleylpyruvate isomerase N-terminal domain-containing protein [Occultella gossypii]MBZ2199302.1 maleylpyruvate isomerase family mycothiol-dependent enzyme [Occultella gossypii]
MPTRLALEDYLGAIGAGVEEMLDAHARAGPAARVPTCPAWTADQLLAHQAMVHRWAAGNVRGSGAGVPITQTRILAEVADLRGYLREGAGALLAAIAGADDDLRAMVFLNDAPPPRLFWARRQAHETTIHAVDARAAALGRAPTAAEVEIPTDLALDGIDELLRGFHTRGRRTSPLFDGTDVAFAVLPTDAAASWRVRVHDGPLVVEDVDDVVAPAEPGLTGTAVQLYLGLWNRGTQIVETGGLGLLDRWRDVRVRWS